MTHFGPWKIPKCLKMGRFGTKNGSKMGQKRVFPRVILDHLGCSKKCFLPILSPVLTQFSPLHHMYAPHCALGTYLKAVWWSHLELGMPLSRCDSGVFLVPLAACACEVFLAPLEACVCAVFLAPLAACAFMVFLAPLAACACEVFLAPLAACACEVFLKPLEACACGVFLLPPVQPLAACAAEVFVEPLAACACGLLPITPSRTLGGLRLCRVQTCHG